MTPDVINLVSTSREVPRINTEDELISIHCQLVSLGETRQRGWLEAAKRVDRLQRWYCKSTTSEQFDIADRCWFALVHALRQTPETLYEDGTRFDVVDGFLDHLAMLAHRSQHEAPVQRVS